jgi:hypothetical protein
MKKTLLIFLIITFIISCSENKKVQEESILGNKAPDNIAYYWGKVALEATANDTERFSPRPTVTSRILGLIFASVYDAWSRYDEKANPLFITDIPRASESERTQKNKEIAISYAAYRTLREYYFSDTAIFVEKMKNLGLDPYDNSLDPSTAVGVGNITADRIIKTRMNDGSNQDGSLSIDGVIYKDYTNYEPVNPPDLLNDINRWQPKNFVMGDKIFAPGCLTAHWHLVEPLILDSASQFRSPPPPLYGSDILKEQVAEVVEMQANITPEEKALVEFMRDGPRSVQQAGHWLIFAQDVSRRDGHSLDEDVKMYFLVTSTAMDAFIACWDTKMFYDYARPYALVHEYFKGQTITGWKGEGKGWGEIKGEEWRPYSPEYFLCPPFPAYVSGHSTVSGGCAEILKLYKGSDIYGESVRLVPGALTEPDNISDTITLNFPTFTKTAEMAGISRVLGGYHIQIDNTEGLELGRKIANNVFGKYKKLIGEE